MTLSDGVQYGAIRFSPLGASKGKYGVCLAKRAGLACLLYTARQAAALPSCTACRH